VALGKNPIHFDIPQLANPCIGYGLSKTTIAKAAKRLEAEHIRPEQFLQSPVPDK